MVLRVPNALPDREATEVDIYGKRGITDGFLVVRFGEGESVRQFEFDLGNLLLCWVLGLFYCVEEELEKPGLKGDRNHKSLVTVD